MARSFVVSLLGIACLVSPPALAWTAPNTPAPLLRLSPAAVQPDSAFTWRVRVMLENPLAVPLLVDSVAIAVEDTSDNETRAERMLPAPNGGLVDSLGRLAPGTSREAWWRAPATIEAGRLTIELFTHDSLGVSHPLAATARIVPGEYSRQHPSEFIEVGGRRVEVVTIAPPDSSRPAAGVLLIHGHAHYARQSLRSARMLQHAGYAVMLLSQPGYGHSEGPPDFMGPHTVAAASAALDRLARTPGVDSTRLAAWGVSRGATVVALLMTRRGDVRAGIAQAGVYDLWAEYRGTAFDGIRDNIVAEAGRDSAAWRERSAAYSASALRGRLLVLHGEDDRNVPVGQAKAFVAQLAAQGKDVESEFFAAAHGLPRDRSTPRAMAFLERALRPAKAPPPH